MSENIEFHADVSQDRMFPLPLAEEEFLNYEYPLTPMANAELIRKVFPEINIMPNVQELEITIISGITLYGFINFFNAFTAVSAIDIYVNGVRVISNLKYSAFSPYYKAFPGYYHIQILQAGKTEDVFISTFINIIGYRVYTGAFSGLDGHTCMLMVNDCIPPIPESFAYLRFIQISPNAPLLNAYLDDALILSEIDYREISRYYAAKEGMHTLKIKDYITGEILKEENHLDLAGQDAYSVYLFGNYTKVPGLQMLIDRDGISHLEF